MVVKKGIFTISTDVCCHQQHHVFQGGASGSSVQAPLGNVKVFWGPWSPKNHNFRDKIDQVFAKMMEKSLREIGDLGFRNSIWEP